VDPDPARRDSPALPTPDERARAAAIVAALPLAERVALVSGRDVWSTRAVPGRAPSIMLTDGPHGVRKQLGDADHIGLAAAQPATCFPPAVTLAATWDPDLLEEVGAALGAEARAADVAVLLGPGLNLKRHPRGGRSFEYFSEDPLLSGTLAAAMVRGIQSQGVAACPKHYAVNNQEGHRMVVDAVVDERTLRELYLRGFERVVRTAAPAALMTAYNRVNGHYVGEHEHLLADILREEWGFAGLVVSDWAGTNDRVAGLRAGLDLEMPGGAAAFDAEVLAAVAEGRLPEADLDRAAARVVAAALHWEAVRGEGPGGAVDHAAHHALARRVAAAGTVLLTNDGLLPLAPTGTIAVVGAFAEVPRYQGAGSSRVNPTRVDALLPCLREALDGTAELRWAPGYDPATGASTPALLAQAAAAAAGADAVVLVVGLPGRAETEGLDRPDCGLPADQGHLVDVVLAANPRTAVVVVSGGAAELPWADRPAAVLFAGLGGQAGGAALADVLLGRVEPAGRLAESLPDDATALAASANFPGLPRQVQYRERHLVGYRFHDTAGVPARFPFGHGLGYTTWALGSPSSHGAGTAWTITVEVTNTGPRTGSHVVQAYLHHPGALLQRPERELVAFATVTLEPGTSTSVELALDRDAFAVWDVAAHAWLVQAGRYELHLGSSCTDLPLQVTLDVASDDVLTPVPMVAGPVASDAEFAALLGGMLPEPDAVRPFTRTTTLGELAAAGPPARAVAALLGRIAGSRVRAEDLDTTEEMLRASITEMPLRGFVQFSGGMLPMAALDRLLAVLNGDLPGLRSLRSRNAGTRSGKKGA
jgi:beta-glucosidase